VRQSLKTLREELERKRMKSKQMPKRTEGEARENEMRKLDTYYNPTSRSTMDKQNVVEDDEETVKVIYFVHNELSSDLENQNLWRSLEWVGKREMETINGK
jgi:hypothetical protein